MNSRRSPGIIWIASYPKSGNTWMRFLLAHLLMSDIHTSADVSRCIPEVGGSPRDQVMLPKDKQVMLKTHWTMSSLIPLFNETLAYVYIVRNPLDVMMSFFNFNLRRFLRGTQKLPENRISQERSNYINTFIGHRGNPLKGTGGGHTNWSENVRIWKEARRYYPSVMVRYEDMLQDTGREIRRVLQLFRHDISDEVIQHAIANTSFEAMKKQEEREIKNKQLGFFYRKGVEKAYDRGIRFMRDGKVGTGFQYLTNIQRQAFIEAFGPTMEDLGYYIDPVSGELQLEQFPYSEIHSLETEPVLGHAILKRTPRVK